MSITTRYVEGCDTCKRIREDNRGFGPAHEASSHCESGRHNHCRCDRCF